MRAAACRYRRFLREIISHLHRKARIARYGFEARPLPHCDGEKAGVHTETPEALFGPCKGRKCNDNAVLPREQKCRGRGGTLDDEAETENGEKIVLAACSPFKWSFYGSVIYAIVNRCTTTPKGAG